jgi:hypothetical protein
MLRMPPPTVPSTLLAGTTTSSSWISPIVLARMPIFGVFTSVESPGNERSTRNEVTLPSTVA